MSVEAPVGGMSVGVAAPSGPAMGAPSFSREMASSPSFAGAKFGAENGGTFNSQTSMKSLFAETVPLQVSSSQFVNEGPVGGGIGNVFNEGEWATLATGNSSTISLQEDVFAQTRPVISVNREISERVSMEDAKSIFGNNNEWSVIRAKVSEVAEMKPNEWISIAPKNVVQDAVKSAAVEDIKIVEDLAVATKTLVYEAPVKAKSSVDTEKPKAGAQIEPESIVISAEDAVQANKVEQLLVETGVYSQDAARQRVEEIVQAKHVEIGEKPAVKVEVREDEQVEEVADVAAEPKSEIATDVSVKQADQKEGKSKNEKQTPPEFTLTSIAVDERAQEERRKSFKGKITELFTKAREKGQKFVRGKDIARIDEETNHRSEFLEQARLNVLDGSFDQDKKDIEAITEFEITPQAQWDAMEEIELILGRNVAVKAVKGVSSNPATDEDVQKVLKFVKNPVISGLSRG